MPCGHLEPKKYRLAIDFFCRPLNGKRKVSFLCALRASAVKNFQLKNLFI